MKKDYLEDRDRSHGVIDLETAVQLACIDIRRLYKVICRRNHPGTRVIMQETMHKITLQRAVCFNKVLLHTTLHSVFHIVTVILVLYTILCAI